MRALPCGAWHRFIVQQGLIRNAIFLLRGIRWIFLSFNFYSYFFFFFFLLMFLAKPRLTWSLVEDIGSSEHKQYMAWDDVLNLGVPKRHEMHIHATMHGTVLSQADRIFRRKLIMSISKGHFQRHGDFGIIGRFSLREITHATTCHRLCAPKLPRLARQVM